jgi:hypothetical protein
MAIPRIPLVSAPSARCCDHRASWPRESSKRAVGGPEQRGPKVREGPFVPLVCFVVAPIRGCPLAKQFGNAVRHLALTPTRLSLISIGADRTRTEARPRKTCAPSDKRRADGSVWKWHKDAVTKVTPSNAGRGASGCTAAGSFSAGLPVAQALLGSPQRMRSPTARFQA